MERYYPLLVHAFAQAYGAPQFYWCDHAPAAAALTVRRRPLGAVQRIWLNFNPTGQWRAGEDVLAECRALRDVIEQKLWRARRRRCEDILYDVVTTSLAILDQRATGSSAMRGALARISPNRTFGHRRSANDAHYLKSRLEAARSEIALASQSTLRTHYLTGMFASVAVAAGVVLPFVLPQSASANVGLLSACAGAAGAVVSTLTRISDRAGPEIDTQLGRWNALLLGVVRPALGFTFGIVIYLLIMSQLVPLAPGDGGRRVAFYSALAFAAGFSERWIPDALGVVGALVTGEHRVDERRR